jgi:hypothetical protein
VILSQADLDPGLGVELFRLQGLIYPAPDLGHTAEWVVAESDQLLRLANEMVTPANDMIVTEP